MVLTTRMNVYLLTFPQKETRECNTTKKIDSHIICTPSCYLPSGKTISATLDCRISFIKVHNPIGQLNKVPLSSKVSYNRTYFNYTLGVTSTNLFQTPTQICPQPEANTQGNTCEAVVESGEFQLCAWEAIKDVCQNMSMLLNNFSWVSVF
jgi:hypothetical protein